MATVLELVTDAYYEDNLIPNGVAPTDAETARGVRLLNRMWQGLLGQSLGENLLDWAIPPSPTSPTPGRYPLYPADQKLPANVWPYPRQNARLFTTLIEPTTVYFQQQPSAGARMALQNVGAPYTQYALTLAANGFLIQHPVTLAIAAEAVIDTVLPGPVAWFFRDDLGTWMVVRTMDSADDSPLPSPEFDDFFTCTLSIRLCGATAGRTPGETTVMTAKAGMAKAKARYLQEQAAATDPDNIWQMPYQAFGISAGLGPW